MFPDIFKEFVKMTVKHDEKAQDTDQCPALRFRMNISLPFVDLDNHLTLCMSRFDVLVRRCDLVAEKVHTAAVFTCPVYAPR